VAQVSAQRTIQAVSFTGACATLVLIKLPYTAQIWVGTLLLIALFVAIPLLGCPSTFEDKELTAAVQSDLSLTANRISVTDSTDVEGYAVGLFKSEILVSRGAIATLSREELHALIHHEDAHLRYRHTELLIIFRSLWMTLGALILTEAHSHWGAEALVFASIWLTSDFLLAKGWLRLAEFHADQAAASRTSIHCYTRLLSSISKQTPAETNERGLGELNSTHPSHRARLEQLNVHS
jgi:Zn-dependent protease with chaperone function